MTKGIPDLKWMKHVKAVDKHLDLNEKWLQHPEKKMNELQAEIDEWDKALMDEIKNIEKYMD